MAEVRGRVRSLVRRWRDRWHLRGDGECWDDGCATHYRPPSKPPCPTHEAVAAMARREADTGAPAGMVAVYVELALRHLAAEHDGPWQDCGDCHTFPEPWATAPARLSS